MDREEFTAKEGVCVFVWGWRDEESQKSRDLIGELVHKKQGGDGTGQVA
jgi:hypothetical protein